MIEEFNMDCKAECDQLNLANITKQTPKYTTKKLKQTNANVH